jgi:hypothetical protein
LELGTTRGVAKANRFVVASGEFGIKSFTLSSGIKLTEAAVSKREDAGELLPVPATAGRALFVARAKGGTKAGGAVLEFGLNGEPVEVCRYGQAPWYAGLVQVGGLIARPTEERSRVVVSRLGRTTKR